MKKKVIPALLLIAMVLVAAGCGAYMLDRYNILPKIPFSGERFGIERLYSPADGDGDGVDDYTDMTETARAYIATRPEYKSAYYAGGYPPEGEGVSTDVIWKAFAGAGYDLKAMVDADIAAAPEAYPAITKPDPNIDFRRVRNLKIFFERHAQVLTCDINDISQWQAGDVVVFAKGHIGIVSDKRDFWGHTWIIHHGSGNGAEEDAISRDKVTGHYRWIAE